MIRFLTYKTCEGGVGVRPGMEEQDTAPLSEM